MEVEEDGDTKDEEDGSIQRETSIKWDYRDAKWKNPNIMYSPMLGDFTGNARGSTFHYRTISTLMTLFQLLWTPTIACGISITLHYNCIG